MKLGWSMGDVVKMYHWEAYEMDGIIAERCFALS
jgi:hypothetical protein